MRRNFLKIAATSLLGLLIHPLNSLANNLVGFKKKLKKNEKILKNNPNISLGTPNIPPSTPNIPRKTPNRPLHPTYPYKLASKANASKNKQKLKSKLLCLIDQAFA